MILWRVTFSLVLYPEAGDLGMSSGLVWPVVGTALVRLWYWVGTVRLGTVTSAFWSEWSVCPALSCYSIISISPAANFIPEGGCKIYKNQRTSAVRLLQWLQYEELWKSIVWNNMVILALMRMQWLCHGYGLSCCVAHTRCGSLACSIKQTNKQTNIDQQYYIISYQYVLGFLLFQMPYSFSLKLNFWRNLISMQLVSQLWYSPAQPPVC